MSEWRVVASEDGLHAVVIDKRKRSVVSVVNGTPCFTPEDAKTIAAALNKEPRAKRARKEFEARDPYHGEFY